jgi:hypothetical protein
MYVRSSCHSYGDSVHFVKGESAAGPGNVMQRKAADRATDVKKASRSDNGASGRQVSRSVERLRVTGRTSMTDMPAERAAMMRSSLYLYTVQRPG